MSRLSRPIPGLDYVSAMSDQGIRANGAQFVMRYLSNYPWKNLTHSEAVSLHAGSIALSTVWEDGAKDMLGGFDLGKSHAEQHVAMARACGKRDGVGAYFFAGDYDTAGDAAATDGYWDGVASIIPKAQCGPYGDGELLARCFERGFGFGWQALVASAWAGNGTLNARAQIAQIRNGASVDHDEAYYSNFGQWDYTPPPPPDADHYERFLGEPIEIWKHKLTERHIVEEFDVLEPLWRQHPAMHTLRHAQLQHSMKLLRDRIWHVAHEHGGSPVWGMPIEWNVDWRGWRWQQLNARMNDSHTVGSRTIAANGPLPY